MNRFDCCGAEVLFGERTARQDLSRYRRKGPAQTTRWLIAAVARAASGGTLLDIGGGVGAIQHALLGAGFETATAVDASNAYLEAAKEEAQRQGHSGRITWLHGDFVELAPDLGPADVVTLDRVICCYPDMEALVTASANKANRLYGLVYPRRAWWNRLGVRLVNFGLAITGRRFRSFVHDPARVETLLGAMGFARRFHQESLIWRVSLFERVTGVE